MSEWCLWSRATSPWPFTPAEAQRAAQWAYEAPFDRNDSDRANAPLFLDIQEDGTGFYAVVDQASHRDVVGFCCFGEEARVLGLEAEEGTIDLGCGLRPDRLSRGLATSLMPLVCAFADRWRPERLRVAIATFNERSIRLCQSARLKWSAFSAGLTATSSSSWFALSF